MSVLQELIVKFNKKKNQELYVRIIKEIQNIDKIWVAFSDASNNYYLGNNNGNATAFVFSEKEYFEKYFVYMEQKGIKIRAVENDVKYRMAFFGDLFRCGFESIVIDSGQTYLSLNIFDIIKKPDTENMPKDAKMIVNPDLLRTANWFFQENALKLANEKMWQLLFSEIFKGQYIIPVDASKIKTHKNSGNEFDITDDSVAAFPMLQNNDGKKFYPFFTDWNELRKYDMESKFVCMAGGFKEMANFAGKSDGIVINPFGSNIMLNAQMLDDIARISAEYKKSSSKISVSDPKKYPLAMVRKISEVLWEKPDIENAYLKTMIKDGKESYLVALKGKLPENKTALFDEIAENALSLSDNIPIDFIDYSSAFAQKVFKNTSPFYTKK